MTSQQVAPNAPPVAHVIEEPGVPELRASFRGTLLRPGDPGYEPARRVWNGMIDRRPALIARCAGAADVIQAVGFARGRGLPLAVRGGGHNVAGNAVCDGGVVIDLSAMKAIRVDPARRTARAEGGVTWGELDRETQAFGLATTGGIVSTTGIGGLTLGGGIGWLGRSYGLACDNLLSADLVTADGQLRTVSATEHADLFWGVRGGGGNFGVATSLEFRLHPVGPVLGGLLIHPFDAARDLLRLYRDFTATSPPELTCFAVLGSSP
jgi:FAD/FMN-containing dehydrogenase